MERSQAPTLGSCAHPIACSITPLPTRPQKPRTQGMAQRLPTTLRLAADTVHLFPPATQPSSPAPRPFPHPVLPTRHSQGSQGPDIGSLILHPALPLPRSSLSSTDDGVLSRRCLCMSAGFLPRRLPLRTPRAQAFCPANTSMPPVPYFPLLLDSYHHLLRLLSCRPPGYTAPP